jgi:hypothetical protein
LFTLVAYLFRNACCILELKTVLPGAEANRLKKEGSDDLKAPYSTALIHVANIEASIKF